MDAPQPSPDGGPRKPERRLALRVQIWGFLQLSAANLVGAALTFVYFTFLLPQDPSGTDLGIDERILSLILFGGYTALVSPFALVRSVRRFRPVRRWLSEGRPPTEEELEATVAMPWVQARLFFRLWVLAAVLFGGLNLYVEPGGLQGFRVFGGVLVAGMITAALNYLLVERTMRPVFVRALRGVRLERPRRVGLRARLVLLWLLSSGLPLLAVGVSRFLEGTGVAALQESLWFVGLGGLLAGLLITWNAARSLADPIDDVRHGLERVEGGDVDVEVPVNDTGEIGLLQSGFNRMVEGLRERRRLEDLFGRHVGVEVARRALDRGVELGGERREASVLFCDITGSTRLAEVLPPEGVVEMLNAFFSAVFRAVDAEGGWVNKFEGDGAMCVFGVPDENPDHAACALRAAFRLRDELERLRERYPELEAGIGVSSGEVVAGDVGAEDRYEYTVIGDPVNEAARLTEESKRRPSRLLTAERAVREAGAEDWIVAGTFGLRGRRSPSTAYEPKELAASAEAKDTRREEGTMSGSEERTDPGPGQESVWDYPKQPRLEPVERPVRVVFAGEEVARSERAVRCLEQGSPPTYYVPPEDVRTEFLRPSEHRTHCPWKGDATYSDVVVGNEMAENVAWTYREPIEDFDDLGGWYAFYADPLECFVGEERVRPQGGYYAGWATSDVVGPFKGARGSR